VDRALDALRRDAVDVFIRPVFAAAVVSAMAGVPSKPGDLVGIEDHLAVDISRARPMV